MNTTKIFFKSILIFWVVRVLFLGHQAQMLWQGRFRYISSNHRNVHDSSILVVNNEEIFTLPWPNKAVEQNSIVNEIGSLSSSTLSLPSTNHQVLEQGINTVTSTQKIRREVQNRLNIYLSLLSEHERQQTSFHQGVENDTKNYTEQKPTRRRRRRKQRNPLLPPHTPGAFIHIGKTGGSSLSKQLEHGCHSFFRKPCRGNQELARNSTILSKTTTYVHVPDFQKLSQDPSPYTKFSYYAISTREPFDRTLSAFTYQHPANRNGAGKNRFLRKAYRCFPTLERFTELLGDEEDHDAQSGDQTKRHAHNDSSFLASFSRKLSKQQFHDKCSSFAQALLDGESQIIEHFYLGYQTVLEKFSLQYRQLMLELRGTSNSTDLQKDQDVIIGVKSLMVLVIRNEEIWRDFVNVNSFLMSLTNMTTTNAPHNLNFGSTNSLATANSTIIERQQKQFKVTKDISTIGRKRLCRALRNEYLAYIRILRFAMNLSPHEKNDSIELSRRNCPDLDVLKGITFP